MCGLVETILEGEQNNIGGSLQDTMDRFAQQCQDNESSYKRYRKNSKYSVDLPNRTLPIIDQLVYKDSGYTPGIL